MGYLIRSVRSTITIGFFRAVGSLICRSPTTIALILLDLADRRSRSDLSCVSFTKILLHDHDRRTRPSAIPHDDHDRRSRSSAISHDDHDRRSRSSPSHITNTIDDHDHRHLIARSTITIPIFCFTTMIDHQIHHSSNKASKESAPINPKPAILSQESWAEVFGQEFSARSPQPRAFSQESSAWSCPPGVLSQKPSVRSRQPEIRSQESSARSAQPGVLSQQCSAQSPQARVLWQESLARSHWLEVSSCSVVQKMCSFSTLIICNVVVCPRAPAPHHSLQPPTGWSPNPQGLWIANVINSFYIGGPFFSISSGAVSRWPL